MSQSGNGLVLVTGASTGIGYALAEVFAKNGHDLILVARHEGELAKIAADFSGRYGITATPIPKDLFEPNAPFELYDEVKASGATVNILVNNAAQGVYGPFVESDINRQLQVIQLNITALTVLTHLFVKDMVARNEGRILQVGSVLSELPAPLQSVYGGTKAYVLSLTEALISELKDTNVTLTTLQPGATDTAFFGKSGAEQANAKIAVEKDKLADPAQVAEDGYAALMKGDDKVVSGLKNKVQVALANVMPETLVADQIRKQSEPVAKK